MSLPDNMLEMDRTEFDEYMLRKATIFSVCVFLGVGQYQTEYFEVKNESVPRLIRREVAFKMARMFRDKILRDAPYLIVRPMIYGIVMGSHGPQLTIYVE